MKILFATGKLNRGFSATNKIISQLAADLTQKGHTCFMAGLAGDCDGSVTVEKGVTMVRIDSGMFVDKAQRVFERYTAKLGENARASARKSFMLRHPVMGLGIVYRYSGHFDESKRARIYAGKIYELVRKESFDAVAVSYMPFPEAYETAKLLKGVVPVIAYQADPWGLHRDGELAENEAAHIAEETELFKTAAHIVTTPALIKLYKEHESYKPHTDKMTAINFANIAKEPIPTEQSVFGFDENCINLLFCGLLEDGYRNPDRFLAVAAQLIEEGLPLKVHFLGVSTSRSLPEYIKKYPDNILHHEAVSLARAKATMHAADFLLNISNTLDNQVPSKIFDYFSMAKPVLNVQKIENCPAREYFDRYPLSFTLEDYRPDISGMKEFLLTAKGKRVEFDTVSNLFRDATSEFAADTLETIIKSLI